MAEIIQFPSKTEAQTDLRPEQLLPSPAIEKFILELKPFEAQPSINDLITSWQLDEASRTQLVELGRLLIEHIIESQETDPQVALELWQSTDANTLNSYLKLHAESLYQQLVTAQVPVEVEESQVA